MGVVARTSTCVVYAEGGGEVDNGCSVDAYEEVGLQDDVGSGLVEEDKAAADTLDHLARCDMVSILVAMMAHGENLKISFEMGVEH